MDAVHVPVVMTRVGFCGSDQDADRRNRLCVFSDIPWLARYFDQVAVLLAQLVAEIVKAKPCRELAVGSPNRFVHPCRVLAQPVHLDRDMRTLPRVRAGCSFPVELDDPVVLPHDIAKSVVLELSQRLRDLAVLR